MKRAYSRYQLKEMDFDVERYKFPTASGKGTGTLAMKQWGNKCLVCYFDMDDGEKIKLTVWREHVEDRYFRPEKSDLDISEVEIGSRMELSYGITRTGKAKFLDANLQEMR